LEIANLWLPFLLGVNAARLYPRGHPSKEGSLRSTTGGLAGRRTAGFSELVQCGPERNDCYDRLEATQKGSLDVTDWLAWFLACLFQAVQGAGETLAAVLTKARFWQHWAGMPMDDRQIKLLNSQSRHNLVNIPVTTTS